MHRTPLKAIALPATLALLAATLPSHGAAAGETSGRAPLLSQVRQLTFVGRRAGEGYFSRDGRKLIFQSEREPGNPFYQIYLMDLESGDVRRLSGGTGKTTCAWIHPGDERVLFASTHRDPEAVAKQEAELAKRAAGGSRRYAWSFDEHYDIYQLELASGRLENLTKSLGYDAEGSWSPDGQAIAFASNRRAYAGSLSEREQEVLARDPSHFMDLYIMAADGSGVRRLTSTPGYDGGPFFSPDGKRIVWRRFAEDGATAEIYTMDVDGTDERQITRLGAMSWAPFFHPSGDYLIFATSLHGFANFELYLIDTEGRSQPVRVTTWEGFDGLPVFSPDGATLSWASSRTPEKTAQIFLADWDDAEARRRLGLAPLAARPANAAPAASGPGPAITARDLRRHVSILASEALEGRLTGSPGARQAGDYVASVFRSLGLEPAGDEGDFLQRFSFKAGVALGAGNRLAARWGDGGAARALTLDQDWRPLAFSRTGPVAASEVVFAGYGIVAPASGGFAAYDSYGELDVRDKWVLVLRYLPEGIGQERRQQLYRYAELQYKATVARHRGARGLIVASGPASGVKQDLVPLSVDAAMTTGAIAAVSVSDRLAASLVAAAGKDLGTLQAALDGGEPVPGFTLPGLAIEAAIDITHESRSGRNVLARLNAGAAPGKTLVVIGAHLDHLGRGIAGRSLAPGEEANQIHPGADDNASGVAGLLEVAERLVRERREGGSGLVHDILFAAWSGEELGTLGSSHFARTLGGGEAREDLRPDIVAYLNMDMIGRLEERLTLQGVGSSSIWRREIERRNAPLGLSIVASDDSYLPGDPLPFYLRKVPILSAFSGVHGDYHTPRDSADKLNYEGIARIARLMAAITRSLAASPEAPDYIRTEGDRRGGRRRTSRVYLGTIPDYAAAGNQGVRISGLAKGAPAEDGGMRAGDLVVEMAGRKIETIYDYSHAVDALKVGKPVVIVVERGGERLTLTVTPGSRE
jgi:Tol biopolymer transport system component